MSESQIGVFAVRISRCTADGSPDYDNPVGAFVLCGGISKFEHDFEVESGSSIFERDAAGSPCVNRKRQDDVKYTTFTLTLCRTDDRLTEIILHGGATLLTDANDYPIGYGIKGTRACGTANTPTGVIIELWSERVECDQRLDPPFKRVVLPRAFLTPKGFSREDGVSMPVFSGYVESNANFSDGPFGDLDDAAAAVLSEHLIYFEVNDDALPECDAPIDYVRIPHAVS